MGRANRLLARRASLIATGFADIKGVPANVPGEARPHRKPDPPRGARGGAQPYPALGRDGKLRLLVFGGSQGARVMSDIVPPADRAACRRNCAPASSSRSRRGARIWSGCASIIAKLGVEFEAEPFFKDLPQRHGRGASGRLPFGRLDRGGTRGDRPALDPRAPAGLARSGPGRQRQNPWRRSAPPSFFRKSTSRPSGWRTRFAASSTSPSA